MANRIMLNETSYHGAGAIKEIATEAKARAFKKAFVCSDPDLIKFGVTKKVILAGIGAVATTAEKSKDVLDDMVKKGELTVEQGKVLNEELKHNLKQTVKNNVNVKVKVTTPEELSELLDKMTPEQLEALKAQIKEKESTVDSEAEEVDAEDTAEDVENVDDAEVVEEETKEE